MLFGKKNEPKMKDACPCLGGVPGEEAGETAAICCKEAERGICCVKVLGMGCRSCRAQYENAKETVRKMGLTTQVQYITDPEEVMAYGVMSMPAVVVNEQVISAGKVLSPDALEKLLHQHFG